MGSLTYVLIGLCIYVTIKNIMMIRRNRVDQGYVECYRKVIAKEEDALDYANEYIEKETLPYLRNKAMIMKLVQEMASGVNIESTLDSINMREIFYDEKGNFNEMQFAQNTDVFLWTMVAMAKAHATSNEVVIDALYNKFEGMMELDNRVEYKLVDSLYHIFKGDGNTEFITNFLIGEYPGYVADRKVISLDKRFAEAIKDYCNEELDDVSRDDIPNFGRTALGQFFMEDLGIYEKYVIKEEVSEELPQEENKEEETKEEE